MQGENMLIIWTLCISVPVVVIPPLKLIGWLRRGRENADHVDFTHSGPRHTHTSLQINTSGCRLYNPFCKHQPKRWLLSWVDNISRSLYGVQYQVVGQPTCPSLPRMSLALALKVPQLGKPSVSGKSGQLV